MTNSPPYPFLTTPVGSLQIPFLDQIEEITSNNSYILRDSPQLLKLSLVIPTYNERDNVIPLVENLSQLLDRKIPGQYELIIVDDDSPDRTWELASKLTPDYPQLRVMRRQGEKGLASAVVRGWQGSRGEILGVIDGDLQHPPE
ncbi:MAG: glycosyltransferase, partial [Microcystis aeruginosa]